MDDAKIGAAVRAVRVRLRVTQADLAGRARVRVADVSHLERGALGELSLDTMRRVASVLGMWIEASARWRGADLDVLVNSAHAALQRAVLQAFARLPGWVAVPEVSYSIFGERGAIDVLCWHEATRTLLIIELKTLLVEAAGLVRKMHERVRLAPQIAAQRGWHPATVASWVILTDTRTNRRHVAAHHEILAPLMGLDGRSMRTWLRSPSGPVSALSFWAEPAAVIARRVRASGANGR